ncbi:MAG: single-stranded DNA-binding protein [Candidatus Altiarchaeales archaeon]|nr:single-stranded DNA-binding protein [Candidatus Altiarchaeales archaeon]MBD3416200.1 single-stranded DNA-binding protein [Candidatus Altiarchaeales archaeon]
MAEEIIKIGELTPKAKRVNVVFKAVSKEDVKKVRSKKDHTPHVVTEATVGDETGTVLLTLWDENVEQLETGKTYKLENGYVTLFKGTIRLNIGKYGELSEAEDLDVEVDMENNMSEKVFEEYQRNRRYEGFGSGSFWP